MWSLLTVLSVNVVVVACDVVIEFKVVFVVVNVNGVVVVVIAANCTFFV